MHLRVKLLGSPQVFCDEHIIQFPFRKAEGLFYYLIVEKVVSREKLAGIFWGDLDQVYALKNLRNALYVLHKTLSPDLIIQDNQWIRINDSAPLSLDIDMLHDLNKIHRHSLEGIADEFLDGFYISKCPEFEEWVFAKRTQIKSFCIENLKSRLALCCKSKSYDTALEMAKLILKLDEFDEEVIRSTMNIYVSLGQITKALQTYQIFKSKVIEILGVSPDVSTESLYDEICLMHQKNMVDRLNNTRPLSLYGSIFGREDELARLHAFCKISDPSRIPKCILITGVPGVGKSHLIRHFLDTYLEAGDLLLSCKAIEINGSQYPLGPWHELLSRLSTSNLSLVGLHTPGTLSDMLAKSIERKRKKGNKVVLYMENLHDFDSASIEVFRCFLNRLPAYIRIIIESRNDDAHHIDALLKSAYRRDSLDYMHIKIYPFTKEGTENFCRFLLPSYKVSPEQLEVIYNYTKGTPLFLKEIASLIAEGKNLNLFSRKLQDIVKEHFVLLPKLEGELLKVISVFNVDASYKLLKSILNNADEQDLAEAINSLMNKGFIIEKIEEGDRHYAFAHSEIKSIIYNFIEREHKRSLHERLAYLTREDMGDWSNIKWKEGLNSIYHLHQANLLIEELKARLNLLKLHLSFNHELFPMLSDETLKSARVPFSEMESMATYGKDVRDLLYEIHCTIGESHELEVLERTYYWLDGSYLVWYGKYREGLKKIYDTLYWAKNRGEIKLELDCLLGLCYFGIQTENGQMLKKYALDMLKAAQSNFLDSYIGVSLRFLGLGYLLTGDLKRAERLFKASIKTFERLNTTRPRNSLSIIAALNYLGDVRHWEGRFEEALSLYEYCISLCNKQGLYHGLSLFHANAGHVAFDLKDHSLMLYHLNKSIQLNEQHNGGRGAAISHTLLALYWATKGEPGRAIDNLRKANHICATLNKKYWIGMLLYTKGIMRNIMDNRDEFKHLWIDELPESAVEYAKEAVCILEGLHIEHERQKACKLLTSLLSHEDISRYLTV